LAEAKALAALDVSGADAAVAAGVASLTMAESVDDVRLVMTAPGEEGEAIIMV
jgi:hypothetical protein